MNPQDPLAALHPLRPPEAIAWWPPAPGWWLLAAAILLLLGGLSWWLWRRYQRQRYRRIALLQLEALLARQQSDGDGTRFFAATNALLKAVALKAYPNREVADSNGARWIDFLNHSMPERADRRLFDADFANAMYRPDNTQLDCTAVADSARYWIKQHRVTR